MARQDALLRLHKMLVNRRAELRKRLGVELHEMGTDSPGADPADVAFDAGSEELASQLAELEAKELGQIERAILKMKHGSFGSCEGCGIKIPVMRLNALPYSVYCVGCQREMESDAGWEPAHAIDWEKVRDSSGLEEREFDLAKYEVEPK